MAHHHNVSKVHCRDCDSNYQPLLNQSDVLGKNENQIAREIVDATEIKKFGYRCVSFTPSIAFSDKECRFLGAAIFILLIKDRWVCHDVVSQSGAFFSHSSCTIIKKKN